MSAPHADREAALRRLQALPRAQLAVWPTPLQPLPRFSAAIGAEVWAKRDDVGSVGLAGNKVRKFELVLGRALLDGADVLVTAGAPQSNSARTAAAAAAALGLRAVLVLAGPPPAQPTANVLLDQLFGAELRFIGPVGWDELNATVEAVAEEARRAGLRPAAAPVGCSSPLGALGFTLGYLELLAQLEQAGLDPPLLYHATTSGGTQAGLAVGRRLVGRGPRIVGVDAGRLFDDPAAAMAALATAALGILGVAEDVPPAELRVEGSQLGAGYGEPTEAANEAIALLARTEGIVCDPVYSGKGLAALVADARRGRLPNGPVVFWHTGGWHALFDPHHGRPVLDAAAAH